MRSFYFGILFDYCAICSVNQTISDLNPDLAQVGLPPGWLARVELGFGQRDVSGSRPGSGDWVLILFGFFLPRCTVSDVASSNRGGNNYLRVL